MKKSILAIVFSALLILACFGCGNTEMQDGEKTPVVLPDKTPVVWSVEDTDVSHIGVGNKLIAFSFDDGLGYNTPQLLDVFAEFNAANPDFKAHATLFMVGANMKKEGDADIISRAVQLGMELGNHSENHVSLKGLSPETIVAELKSVDETLKAFDGKEKHLVRPPFGDYDDNVLAYAKTPLIMWTDKLNPDDWDDKNGVQHIHDTIYNNLTDGGIAIMHQGHANTIPAVKKLLPELKAKGYQVVSVSELAKTKGVTLSSGSVCRKIVAI